MGSGPLAGLLSPSSPNPPVYGWQGEAGGCRELVMRYGVIHLQVTSSKPGQRWVKVPDQGDMAGFHLRGLKADICPLRRQLRHVSLGHRARSSVPGNRLCRPERPPRGACPSGFIVSETLLVWVLTQGFACPKNSGRQRSEHLAIALFPYKILTLRAETTSLI